MENNKHPTLTNGKVCYVEIPAVDVRRSAEFYEKVFGWRIRQRGDGSIAFDDTVGEVSGTWVLGRPPVDLLELIEHPDVRPPDTILPVELIVRASSSPG